MYTFKLKLNAHFVSIQIIHHLFDKVIPLRWIKKLEPQFSRDLAGPAP
jgi:hypothetical protein